MYEYTMMLETNHNNCTMSQIKGKKKQIIVFEAAGMLSEDQTWQPYWTPQLEFI